MADNPPGGGWAVIPSKVSLSQPLLCGFEMDFDYETMQYRQYKKDIIIEILLIIVFPVRM